MFTNVHGTGRLGANATFVSEHTKSCVLWRRRPLAGGWRLTPCYWSETPSIGHWNELRRRAVMRLVTRDSWVWCCSIDKHHFVLVWRHLMHLAGLRSDIGCFNLESCRIRSKYRKPIPLSCTTQLHLMANCESTSRNQKVWSLGQCAFSSGSSKNMCLGSPVRATHKSHKLLAVFRHGRVHKHRTLSYISGSDAEDTCVNGLRDWSESGIMPHHCSTEGSMDGK